MQGIPYLSGVDPDFPDYHQALQDPDGLLAIGGQLNCEWLTESYRLGIFPWFNTDKEELLWWCPSNRAVIQPGEMHVSKSLKKIIKSRKFSVTFDLSFDAVIENCSIRNDAQEGTWITSNMKSAYKKMHSIGLAHSIEVKSGEKLAGGLYGVSLGNMFFAESMFFREANASKVALYFLQSQLSEWGFNLLDCQIMNPHLESLGAKNITREAFIAMLKNNPIEQTRQGKWSLEGGS